MYVLYVMLYGHMFILLTAKVSNNHVKILVSSGYKQFSTIFLFFYESLISEKGHLLQVLSTSVCIPVHFLLMGHIMFCVCMACDWTAESILMSENEQVMRVIFTTQKHLFYWCWWSYSLDRSWAPTGLTVVWWLALLSHSKRVPGANFSRCLSVWSLNVFPVSVWVLSRYSGYLPQSKTCILR